MRLAGHLGAVLPPHLLAGVDGPLDNTLDALELGAHLRACASEDDGVFKTALLVWVVHKIIRDGVCPLGLASLLELIRSALKWALKMDEN